MNSSYEVTKLRDGDVFVGSGSMGRLAKVDAVVFDCDGTLIDVRQSYDATIMKTTASMIEGFFGKPVPIEEVDGELILKIRRTGGFNSDWDLTYALTLFSLVALDGRVPKDSLSEAETATATAQLQLIVSDFASKERFLGWKSIDQYLVGSRFESNPMRELRMYLGYPGNPLTSRLAATFDQLYYGEDLYRRVYGVMPEVAYKKGLIDREQVIVTDESLSSFSEMVGGKRMAMATGRPFVAVEHTLGRLLDYFERDASVYIGDGDIFPDLAPKLSKFKKPSGESLVLARKKFSSKVLLYVGDSAEDRLMVENADIPNGSVLFAGIYGSSFNDKEQISYFTGTNSDLIVENVNQIPGMLELAKN
jgi:phosphoglycolate phosphatase-like HAD superfamily hydrolase